MATLAELEQAVNTARDAGCDDLILLKCTSNYPASPVNTNISTIPHLKSLFQTEVGLVITRWVGVPFGVYCIGSNRHRKTLYAFT